MCSSLKGSSEESQEVNERNLNNFFYLQVYMASGLGHRQVQSKRIVFFFILFMTMLGLHGGRLALCCCIQATRVVASRLLIAVASFIEKQILKRRGLGNCGTHRHSCLIACGILVPRPEIELMSPALEGRFFLTSGPPGKSQNSLSL